MDAIKIISARLQKYADAKYEIGINRISVFPDSRNGFQVNLITFGKRYLVQFNGWHETFTDVEEAMNCFVFGLSDKCRLRECRRLGIAYKWTVEHRVGDKWKQDSTTGLFLYPFWGSLETRYLQNWLISTDA